MRRETLFLYCWLAVSLPQNGEPNVVAGKAVVLMGADRAGGWFPVLAIHFIGGYDSGAGGGVRWWERNGPGALCGMRLFECEPYVVAYYSIWGGGVGLPGGSV